MWEGIQYVPAERGIRIVAAPGKGQCSSGDNRAPRSKLETAPRLHEIIVFPKGQAGSHIPPDRDVYLICTYVN